MPIPAGYQGFAALGDVLGGGATRRADARGQEYLGQASDTAYKFNRAAQERSDAIIKQSMLDHRQALDTALPGVYTDPKQAALASAVLGSNSTVDMDQLGKFQKPSYRALDAEQQDALGKGDFKRVNAITAVLGDKQFEPVIEKGGAYIENGATLGDLDAIPTPATAERIDQMHAQTAQGQQRTNAAVAKSNRAPAPRGHSSAPNEETAILDQARERIAKGADPAKVASYLRGKGYPGVAKKIYGGP
jgi:hypothetical protein